MKRGNKIKSTIHDLDNKVDYSVVEILSSSLVLLYTSMHFLYPLRDKS